MQSLTRSLLFGAVLCLGVTSTLHAETASGGGTAEKDPKAFATQIEDFQLHAGFLNLYHNEKTGQVFLEIQPAQLDQLYLASLTRDAGDGTWFDAGAMLGRFPFVFRKVGNTIQLVEKNLNFRADADGALHRAVERDLSDALLGAAPIQGEPHPQRGSVLVDASHFFLQDVGQVQYIFSEWFPGLDFSFDKANSYFSKFQNFEHNTEIQVTQHFRSSGFAQGTNLAGSGNSFFHVYHFSLSELPGEGFKPRLADDRVGHFITMFQDYSSVMAEEAYVRYVDRWRLEKAEPRYEVSAPKKPIVFWLENTIPVEYRAAVRQGILVWNDAFEKIGFKDAIVVKQQPDDADWSPGDSRYATVRWIVQPGGGYAVGPSNTDPRTGEIFDADIRLSADMLRWDYLTWEDVGEPTSHGAPGDAIARKNGLYGSYAQGFCDFQTGYSRESAFGLSLLEARGLLDGQEGMDLQRYVQDAVIAVIAHEVGHTLGLRHNFKASNLHTLEQLQDVERTTKMGLTGSVMDYNPINIAPPGSPQGQYHQTTLGTYDYWAIEYAYRPFDAKQWSSEEEMLASIASRAAEPELAYATDEDAFGDATGIDPTATRWDLGKDSVHYYESRMALAKELWGKLPEFQKEGEGYQRFARVFRRAFGQYRQGVGNLSKFVGGLYHRRDHIGDPGGRVPFEPVPAAQQRRAFQYLTQGLLSADAFQFEPETLNQLAPTRFPDFTYSIWETERIEWPIHRQVFATQASILASLLAPVRLERLVDLELRYTEGQEAFTLTELFQGLRTAIWSEASAGQSVNSFRRALQREHLRHLVALVVGNQPAPEDARTLARADLLDLKAELQSALQAEGTDRLTRAHWDESQARIQAALEAGMQRSLGF